jgi:hypothetical protein
MRIKALENMFCDGVDVVDDTKMVRDFQITIYYFTWCSITCAGIGRILW